MNTLELLSVQHEELQRERYQVEEQRNEELRNIILANFRHILRDDMEITGGGSNYTFNRSYPGYSYKKEMLDLYFKENYSIKEEEEHFTKGKLRLSCYSTSDESDWEIERLVTIGGAAQVILEKRDDIIEQFNKVWEKYRKEIRDNYTQSRDIQNSITSLRNLEEEKKLSKLLLKVHKGEQIEFENLEGSTEKCLKLPVIQLGWNDELRSIKKIKASNFSSSGKTCDLSFTLNYIDSVYPNKENGDTDYSATPTFVVIEREHSRQRVKTSYIEKFLKSYADQVVQPQNTVAS